MYEVIVS